VDLLQGNKSDREKNESQEKEKAMPFKPEFKKAVAEENI
jgi:hypothetical protein